MNTNKVRRNRRSGYLAVALTTLLAPADEPPREDEILRTSELDDTPVLSARAAVVPEPSSWALLAIGLLGLTWTQRKKTT